MMIQSTCQQCHMGILSKTLLCRRNPFTCMFKSILKQPKI